MLLHICLFMLCLTCIPMHFINAMDSQTNNSIQPRPVKYATFSDNGTDILVCNKHPFNADPFNVAEVQRFNTQLYLQGKQELAEKVAAKEQLAMTNAEFLRIRNSCSSTLRKRILHTSSHKIEYDRDTDPDNASLKDKSTKTITTVSAPNLRISALANLASGIPVLAHCSVDNSSIIFKDLVTQDRETTAVGLPTHDGKHRLILSLTFVCPREKNATVTLAVLLTQRVHLIDVKYTAQNKLVASLKEHKIIQTSDTNEPEDPLIGKYLTHAGSSSDGKKLIIEHVCYRKDYSSGTRTARVYCADSGTLLAHQALPRHAKFVYPGNQHRSQLSDDYSALIMDGAVTKMSNDFVRTLAFHDVRQERESRIPSKNIVHLLGDRQLTNNRVLSHRKSTAQQAIMHK